MKNENKGSNKKEREKKRRKRTHEGTEGERDTRKRRILAPCDGFKKLLSDNNSVSCHRFHVPCVFIIKYIHMEMYPNKNECVYVLCRSP